MQALNCVVVDMAAFCIPDSRCKKIICALNKKYSVCFLVLLQTPVYFLASSVYKQRPCIVNSTQLCLTIPAKKKKTNVLLPILWIHDTHLDFHFIWRVIEHDCSFFFGGGLCGRGYTSFSEPLSARDTFKWEKRRSLLSEIA